jgi:hypothetical protein
MTHIAIQEKFDGKPVDWLEHVTAEQYEGRWAWAKSARGHATGRTFGATLSHNATAAAFKKLLPRSIILKELNGNEKFAELPLSLPTEASTPRAVQTGDLMLYGSSTLVLFYKSFRTTYRYTNIGRLDDPAGLEPALSSGNVDVTFEAKDHRKQLVTTMKTSQQDGRAAPSCGLACVLRGTSKRNELIWGRSHDERTIDDKRQNATLRKS